MSSGASSPDLLTRLLADATLEEAYAWLCSQRQDYSHNSDVWALRQHWSEVKDGIRREVAAGTYAFEPIQVYHIDGETRDVWAARDAVVLKALAIVLGAYLTPRLPPTIYHLAGRGGIKGALRTVMSHLTSTSHVMRSDVQSYYASIDHYLVYHQVCEVIPDQRLHVLLWEALRCTVCDGGNYREVRRGISRSSPLSPLLGALYLTPLDEAIATLPVRYVRYMDDWVVIASSRWHLRQAIRVVNQHLARLHLRQHPDKTWIGRAQRGFDFLAYHLRPGRLSPALQTLHHCLERMSQLYEQGAGLPRIGVYFQHWSRWVTAGGGWFAEVFRPCGCRRRPVPWPRTHQLMGRRA